MDNLTTCSRRRFLGLGGTVSASVLLAGDRVLAQTLAAVQGAKKIQDREEYWRFIGAQFMLEPDRIHLNAGTTGLMPRPIVEAEAQYQRELAGNPKVRGLFESFMVPEVVRKKAAMLIGADLEDTALTHNTTEGLNIAAHGLPVNS